MTAAAAAADEVPSFDFTVSCRSLTKSGASSLPSQGTATVSSCENDERDARTKLVAQWSQFVAEDRTRCTQETQTGGYPSYVELITCLQLARDARHYKQ